MFSIPVPDIMFTSKCNLNCKYCFEHEKNGKDVDMNLLKAYIDKNTNRAFFPFGGEPLIVLDKIIEIKRHVEQLDGFEFNKQEKLSGLNHIITNATLIKQNIEKIKEEGFRVQISIDGPKHVNDINRVYHNGKGTFDDIMEAIELCQKEKIDWNLHGVITKKTIPYFFETTQFFFNMIFKHKGLDHLVNKANKNIFQIVFEDEFDDNDVDILLDQFYQACEWMWNDKRFAPRRKDLLHMFLTHRGAMCAVGTTLFAIDYNLDIYPCHRNVLKPEAKLGNVNDIDHFENYKVYNSMFRQKTVHRKMYSTFLQTNGNDISYWFYWCPSTNLETTGSIYYQAPKYNVMMTELNRLVMKLLKKYWIN